MLKTTQWQSKTALLLALTVSLGAGMPVVSSGPVLAQTGGNGRQWNAPRNNTNNRVAVPSGTILPVNYEKDKVVVTKDETAPLTLIVARDISSSSGTILIRQGTQIVGELRPVGGGSQFIAKELVLQNGQRFPVNARSKIVTRTETIEKGASVGSILQGAAIGAAAATAISAITGDRAIATEEVLGGAGLGAIGGLLLGRKKVDVVVINPNTDLALTLRSDLALR
ncbi:hypothetical protein NG798_19450 [Ancylothrix sp. C2]|uniref:hypothetical protein n=1 Tax=Ancylothrix sp. D3o TaxID=2953691 RepID=UPI0021BB4061|nr:hypothetical protein [Ancylothrix sp. D3o]MCT7951978.1 hypothetical protein [Ancylothrix sp. D3o]